MPLTKIRFKKASFLVFIITLITSNSCFANFKNLEKFGDNPGELTASYFKPQAKTAPQTIVVLLHGCTQNAEQFAKNTGFMDLAQQHNFILLLPQQSKKNNIKGCFNWFSITDNAKEAGELLSIKNMLLTLKQQLAIKTSYIAGFSAGGAMTAALLVHYPELFNGGAVVGGIPYPCADGLIKAIACMRNGPAQSANKLAELVKNKQTNTVNHWPNLLVITGDNDKIVNPKNGRYLAQQWQQLKGLSKSETHKKEHLTTTLWRNNQQQLQIELIEIANIGHAFSVNPKLKNGGKVASFINKASISSAIKIIDFWEITSKNIIKQ
ncbi:MAG: PHB depolymerase family esterase [Alteromonadaceae bacterium]|nr:PHB depolymerase family esterase [Alteromonadaceae bacterium]